MSSHQTVVSTTLKRLSVVSHPPSHPSRKMGERDPLVVANCVPKRFPMIPCKPMLALISPKHAYVAALLQAGTSRVEATLPCPLFQSEIAAAIVKSAWMIVPRNNHRRVFAPIRSPMRPMKAPKRKVVREVRACLSAIWKEVSWCPGGPWKRRASARES
jgi:hypothetical protein